MSPSSAIRSFAITLAIAITIVGPGANGFTINRTNSTSAAPSTDLPVDESSRLQVRNDLRRPNNITSKNEESNRTTESKQTNNVIEKISKAPDVTTGKPLNIALTTTTVRSTTEFAKIPTISSDTVEVFDSVEDTKMYNKTESITNDGNGSELELTEKSAVDNQMQKKSPSFGKTEAPLTTVDHIATKLDEKEDYPTRKTVIRSILNDEITTSAYNVTEIPMLTETTNVLSEIAMEETDVNRTEQYLITTDLPQTVSYASAISIDDIIVTTVSSDHFDTDITQTSTDNMNKNITEPFSEKYPKYITLNRKQTTLSEEFTATATANNEEMKAETSNTQENFNKVFNITTKPSLDKRPAYSLPLELSISREVSQGSEKATREVELTTPYTNESTELRKLGTVETKRAGFIDNSEKVTTPIVATTNKEVKENVTDVYQTVEDSTVAETGSPDVIKVSGSESQSQLAEDELQEEFLKEEALNNHKENAIRYRDNQSGIEVVKTDNDVDSLSVQPIERTKTTLYTLSPNYKPMKKIDVQPAKQFVRDPDDNSWRNESISSLGIVFKPKNSSKSFKEVLKNKTQTELNSLTEQTKDDVPDLRVRLEKIAEVRKTRKRKMNKDGEVVYTDYEENSAETSGTPKPDVTSSKASPTDPVKLLTPSNSQPDIPPKIEHDITTPMTALKHIEEEENEKPRNALDLFSRLGLDPLTTLKPKKFFNIAEYYDTTDEYDADYVTMSNLDLKKFTVPPRTTRPAPVRQYVPERRPTVQYFPPREPPRAPVNLNNVDRDFERKINLYSFKDHPRVEPRPPFVTVPPLPMATAKPKSQERPHPSLRPPTEKPDARPAVDPTHFMYPPVDLNKYYLTNAPPTTESEAFLAAGGRLDRGSYVIKHYKDFLNAAVDDDEKTSDFLPYLSTLPPREALDAEPDRRTLKPRDDEEDYDARFRKDVLTRFVDNFNQNSERFKVDFPILYNNSIVHRKGEGSPASSRTFLKRLYHEGATRASGPRKSCEPHCDLTVELSPAYELHYYVPNQEERQEQEPRSPSPELAPALAPAPDRYGL